MRSRIPCPGQLHRCDERVDRARSELGRRAGRQGAGFQGAEPGGGESAVRGDTVEGVVHVGSELGQRRGEAEGVQAVAVAELKAIRRRKRTREHGTRLSSAQIATEQLLFVCEIPCSTLRTSIGACSASAEVSVICAAPTVQSAMRVTFGLFMSSHYIDTVIISLCRCT